MVRTLCLALLLVMGPFVMADEHTRLITVDGTGVAAVEPDRAIVHMSIVSRESSLAAAQSGAARVTKNVLEMTDDLRIDRDQVDTTGASVRADYRWNRETEKQELKGYIAERQIVIEMTDLDKLGEVVEGAVSAGVNRVTPPQLDSSRRRDAHRQALEAAAKDARANAKRLAKALGAKLGQVVSINASNNAVHTPQPLANMRAMVSDEGAAETYNSADLRFSANVSVVFELED